VTTLVRPIRPSALLDNPRTKEQGLSLLSNRGLHGIIAQNVGTLPKFTSRCQIAFSNSRFRILQSIDRRASQRRNVIPTELAVAVAGTPRDSTLGAKCGEIVAPWNFGNEGRLSGGAPQPLNRISGRVCRETWRDCRPRLVPGAGLFWTTGSSLD
jgi:hypothetical protein